MSKEMHNKPEQGLECSDCHSIITEKLNCVPNIIVLTGDSDSTVTIDMKQALNIISDYGYKKYYHLSASEILLLRPDVASKAFKQIFKKLMYFGFEFRVLCKSCYIKHKQKNPLK